MLCKCDKISTDSKRERTNLEDGGEGWGEVEGVTRRGGTGGGMSLRTDGGDVDGGERSRARPVFPLSNDDTDSLCKVLFFATQLEGSCNKENTRGFLKVSYFFILDVYFLN